MVPMSPLLPRAVPSHLIPLLHSILVQPRTQPCAYPHDLLPSHLLFSPLLYLLSSLMVSSRPMALNILSDHHALYGFWIPTVNVALEFVCLRRIPDLSHLEQEFSLPKSTVKAATPTLLTPQLNSYFIKPVSQETQVSFSLTLMFHILPCAMTSFFSNLF